jgi:hypothetical protein
MPWEQRGDKRYFYRCGRRNGRSCRVYVGTGPVAELAAAIDDLARLKRESERRDLHAEQARLAGVERLLHELGQGIELLSHGALIAAGFHRHARGVWRLRRVGEPAE